MSGDGEPVLLTEESEAVLTVTLNRPDRLNALDPALMLALTTAWAHAADPGIRAVVVTGSGRGFCSGVDLRAERSRDPTPTGIRTRLNPLVLGLASLAKPVIAAVNGVAAGAGLSLACAADVRVASTAARFVPAFAKVGLTPDAGATYFVPRLLGPARAFEWFAGGESLDAAGALQLGLVSEIVEPEALLTAAHTRALGYASVAGEALSLTKQLMQRAMTSTLAEQLELEAQMQLRALAAPGRDEARAAVVERIHNGNPQVLGGTNE
jgi:2-(1,2-epoxy-1,2-dihydrophenyl)acetyl-CoA isomerase